MLVLYYVKTIRGTYQKLVHFSWTSYRLDMNINNKTGVITSQIFLRLYTILKIKIP